VQFNRCTNKIVDDMKLIQLLLCEGITANLFVLVLADSSRAFHGLIWVRGLGVEEHWYRHPRYSDSLSFVNFFWVLATRPAYGGQWSPSATFWTSWLKPLVTPLHL